MSKMKALKDFADPYDGTIHVAGTEFDLTDEPLAEYLVGMNHLEYLEDDDPAPAPVFAATKKGRVATPAPTKADLSSGFSGTTTPSINEGGN